MSECKPCLRAAVRRDSPAKLDRSDTDIMGQQAESAITRYNAGGNNPCMCNSKLVRATIHAIVPEVCLTQRTPFGMCAPCGTCAAVQTDPMARPSALRTNKKEDRDKITQTKETRLITSGELEFICQGLRPFGFKEDETCECLEASEKIKKKEPSILGSHMMQETTEPPKRESALDPKMRESVLSRVDPQRRGPPILRKENDLTPCIPCNQPKPMAQPQRPMMQPNKSMTQSMVTHPRMTVTQTNMSVSQPRMAPTQPTMSITQPYMTVQQPSMQMAQPNMPMQQIMRPMQQQNMPMPQPQMVMQPANMNQPKMGMPPPNMSMPQPTMSMPQTKMQMAPPNMTMAPPNMTMVQPKMGMSQPQMIMTQPSMPMTQTMMPMSPPKMLPAAVSIAQPAMQSNLAISQPSMVMSHASVAATQPSMVITQPGIAMSQPSLLVPSPKVAMSQPSIVIKQPSIMTQSGMIISQPSVVMTQPSIAGSPQISPPYRQQSTPSKLNMSMSTPASLQREPSLKEQIMSANKSCAEREREKLRGSQSAGVRDPGMVMRDPSMAMRDPSMAMRDPSMVMRDPSMAMRDPSMAMRDPSMSMRPGRESYMPQRDTYRRESMLSRDSMRKPCQDCRNDPEQNNPPRECACPRPETVRKTCDCSIFPIDQRQSVTPRECTCSKQELRKPCPLVDQCKSSGNVLPKKYCHCKKAISEQFENSDRYDRRESCRSPPKISCSYDEQLASKSCALEQRLHSKSCALDQHIRSKSIAHMNQESMAQLPRHISIAPDGSRSLVPDVLGRSKSIAQSRSRSLAGGLYDEDARSFYEEDEDNLSRKSIKPSRSKSMIGKSRSKSLMGSRKSVAPYEEDEDNYRLKKSASRSKSLIGSRSKSLAAYDELEEEGRGRKSTVKPSRSKSLIGSRSKSLAADYDDDNVSQKSLRMSRSKSMLPQNRSKSILSKSIVPSSAGIYSTESAMSLKPSRSKSVLPAKSKSKSLARDQSMLEQQRAAEQPGGQPLAGDKYDYANADLDEDAVEEAELRKRSTESVKIYCYPKAFYPKKHDKKQLDPKTNQSVGAAGTVNKAGAAGTGGVPRRESLWNTFGETCDTLNQIRTESVHAILAVEKKQREEEMAKGRKTMVLDPKSIPELKKCLDYGTPVSCPGKCNRLLLSDREISDITSSTDRTIRTRGTNKFKNKMKDPNRIRKNKCSIM